MRTPHAPAFPSPVRSPAPHRTAHAARRRGLAAPNWAAHATPPASPASRLSAPAMTKRYWATCPLLDETFRPSPKQPGYNRGRWIRVLHVDAPTHATHPSLISVPSSVPMDDTLP